MEEPSGFSRPPSVVAITCVSTRVVREAVRFARFASLISCCFRVFDVCSEPGTRFPSSSSKLSKTQTLQKQGPRDAMKNSNGEGGLAKTVEERENAHAKKFC